MYVSRRSLGPQCFQVTAKRGKATFIEVSSGGCEFAAYFLLKMVLQTVNGGGPYDLVVILEHCCLAWSLACEMT